MNIQYRINLEILVNIRGKNNKTILTTTKQEEKENIPIILVLVSYYPELYSSSRIVVLSKL